MKDELAKVSSPQNDKPLYGVMKEQKIHIGKEVLVMLPRRRRRTRARRRPSLLKKRRMTLLVERPQGVTLLGVILLDLLTLTIFSTLIIMGMSMQNMLAHMMVLLLTLFGSQRPL